jgi:hypothetical protein|tara:strand:- start:456 stop:980 length:525 start_codon:yes stop_codon:yes gene_type:complete
MGLEFEVHGPTQVLFHNSAGSTPTNVLGYTDNNDLVSLEMEYPQEAIYTTRSGNIPEAHIHMGVIGRLTMTLVKWDADFLTDIMHALPGAAVAEGDVGQIGGLKTTGEGNFSIKISSSASEHTYTMKNCYLDGPVRRLDFGNKPSRIGLNIICLPYEASEGTLAVTDSVYEVTR